MPGAACIVSTMSSISFCSLPSTFATCSAGRRRTSSPYFTMGRTATFRLSALFLEILDHGLDGVLRALLVEIVEHFADAGVLRQRVVELLFVEAKQLGPLRRGDRRRARFSGQHAHFSEKIPFAELRQIDAAAAFRRCVYLHFARGD